MLPRLEIIKILAFSLELILTISLPRRPCYCTISTLQLIPVLLMLVLNREFLNFKARDYHYGIKYGSKGKNL